MKAGNAATLMVDEGHGPRTPDRRRVGDGLDRFDPDEQGPGALRAMTLALRAKDAYTHAHSRRVGIRAVAIARELNLGKDLQREIRLAGELHDMGKIGVPGELLRRPGKLTPDEHRRVLTHTLIGERMLAPLMSSHPVVLSVVRSHHERVDGRGFPDGLAGAAIPLPARIVAVADAFDAMTSGRSYRPAVSRGAALTELMAHAGTQFYSTCVRALARALARERRVRSRGPRERRRTAGSKLRSRRNTLRAIDPCTVP